MNVKIVNDTFPSGLEQHINDALKVISEEGKKVIDVKLSESQSYCEDLRTKYTSYTACIMYE